MKYNKEQRRQKTKREKNNILSFVITFSDLLVLFSYYKWNFEFLNNNNGYQDRATDMNGKSKVKSMLFLNEKLLFSYFPLNLRT